MNDLSIRGIGLLVTNRPELGTGLLGTVADAAVVIRDGRVVFAGPAEEAPDTGGEVLDAAGGCVLPGFVDAHTHVVFAGDRAGEFQARLRGASYEELLAAGGGILSTVQATREASEDQLLAGATARARRMLANGTTTVEVKSGYGLDLETELRLLRVAGRLATETGIDVVPTFLAHTIPSDRLADREAYVDEIVDSILPACAPHAAACDVFCDRGAFDLDETRRILGAGRRLGLDLRLHAEQLARTGAAGLGAELGVRSVDHLDHATEADAEALARAGVAAVLLPGVSLQLRTPPPPARMLWEAGVTVALATDCNPGSSYLETMPLVVALGCSLLGLTVEQSTWAATRGGALALGIPDAGTLSPGAKADLVVLDAPGPAHLAYRPDSALVAVVVKAGRPIG
ncbi:MAG: imidazolonepropionase [Acidimicrobiia bacterium]